MALQLFKIAEVTVASPQANIEFTSIPSGYTDLKLVVSSRASGTNDLLVRFNSDTGSNYPNRVLYGGGGTGSLGSFGNTYSGIYILSISNGGAFTANTFASAELYIPNYTGSNYKSASGDSAQENNSSTAGQTYCYLTAGLWNNTAAITNITVHPGSNTFLTNSTATLYGIL